MACFRGFGMNEEDEAFEELSRRQGDWGMQGSRKHQIMRYAENVENKGTSMTDKEAMKLALFALDIVKINYTQSRHVNEAIVALKERLAQPAQRTWVGLTDEEILSDDTLRYYYGMNGGAGPVSQKGKKVIAAIEAKLKQKNGYAEEKNT